MASLLFSLSLLAKHTHDKRKERKATARAEFNDARFAELQRETDEAARWGGKHESKLEHERQLGQEQKQGREDHEREGEGNEDRRSLGSMTGGGREEGVDGGTGGGGGGGGGG